MGRSNVKEYSVFPNGKLIRNDRFVEILEVIYDLLETFDGQTVLYLMLFKIRFGKLSPLYPRRRKVKNFRFFIVEELGFLTKGARIPRDVLNMLTYLDEANNLFEKLHYKLVEGKKANLKLSLSLDQYDPQSKKVFHSKNAWKAKTDEDFRKGIGESTWNFLADLGED